MQLKIDLSFLKNTLKGLLAVPSPVGYYTEMKPVIERYAAALGHTVAYDNRDTAYITVEGEDSTKTVCVGAHADT